MVKNHGHANIAGNRNLYCLSRKTQESTDDVEATIPMLFPLADGKLTSIKANRIETRDVVKHSALDMPDRRYPDNACRTIRIPNRKYGTTKRLRNVRHSTSKKVMCN